MTLPASATPAGLEASGLSMDRPPADPAEWTLDDAARVVRSQTPSWTTAARLFVVDGDHWQSGAGWIGPAPAVGEDGRNEALEVIKAGFTSRNVLLEISKRYTSGCVGDEPAWQLVPRRPMEPDDEATPEEQALIDEANAALTTWWDRYELAPLFWQAVFQMSWGARSPLRLYLSSDAFTTIGTDTTKRTGVEKQATLEDALRLILLDIPKLESAAVYVDPDTRRMVGVYLFKSRAGNEGAEIVYTDRNGKTFFRTIGGDEDQAAIETPLAGYLSHYQLIRPTRLLTDAAFSMQKALNLSMTVIPRTIVTAGFLERWLINARLPGKMIEGPNGGKVFQPDPNFAFGAGATGALYGEKTDDGQGKQTIVPADVKWREPISPEGAIEGADGIYAKLLEECAQAHVMLSSEATPSGRSRREARADYENSLKEGKLPIQSAGRWLIEGALALAEYLMNQPGRFTGTLRAQFDVKLNAGPAEPEDRAQNLTEWEKGARSIESVMVGAGIQDPAAEQTQISREPGARLEIARRQAETALAWTNLGASIELAAEIAGIDPEILKRLKKELADAEAADRANPTGDPDPNPGEGGEGGGTEDEDDDDEPGAGA
jgi:hypothetical protein